MELYTVQMAKHRKVKEAGLVLVDTTVKTGLRLLAPTWDMVWGYKNHSLSDKDYTKQYREIIQKVILENEEFWNDLLNLDKIAIACYCKAGHFCHRLILKDIIKHGCVERGIDFIYRGEYE